MEWAIKRQIYSKEKFWLKSFYFIYNHNNKEFSVIQLYHNHLYERNNLKGYR